MYEYFNTFYMKGITSFLKVNLTLYRYALPCFQNFRKQVRIIYYLCIVKIISALLTILFLGLLLFPCADEVIGETCGTEVHFHAQADQDHQSESDLCSPFCQCQCCQTHVAKHQIINLGSFTVHFVKAIFIYTDDLGKEIPDSLLQPPQA